MGQFIELADFNRQLDEELASGSPGVALARVEYDRIERIAEWLGDDACREVCDTLAERILDAAPSGTRATSPTKSLVFVLLSAADADPDSLATLAWNLMERISATMSVGGTLLSIGCTVAVAHPDTLGNKTPSAWLNAVTTASHRASALGSRRIAVFEKAHGVFGREGQLDGSLHEAVEKGQIIPWFQPQVRLADGAIVAAEALVRWDHPEHGLVQPASFVPEAELSGYIRNLDLQVIRKAAIAAATWPSAVKLSVNLSAASLDDPYLAQKVADALDAAGLSASRVVMEVTETALVQSQSHAKRRLAQLKDLGLTIALDDFGAGHAYLSILGEGLFDELKIDRSLVSGQTFAAAGPVLNAMTRMAIELGLHVVAEGIETHEQVQRVLDAGCLVGQGFYLHRPMPGDMFRNLVGAPAPH